MQNVLLVAQQVAILFILVGAGVIAAKTKIVNRDGAATLTNIAFYFATPCAIIKAFYSIHLTPEVLGDLGRTALFASLATVSGLLLSHLLFLKEGRERRAVLRIATAFPNCGFMGIPLASALLGEESVAYLSIYIVVFNLFCWTLGVRLFQPEAKTSLKSLLLNPGVMGLIGGGLVILYGRELPLLLAIPIDAIAALNTPLAMLVMGFYVAGSSFRLGRDIVPVSLTIASRQVVIPLAAIGLCWLLNLRGPWLMATMVACVAPPAMNAMMFAQKFGGDARLGAVLTTYANLISIATMPLLMGLCFQLFA